MKLNVDFRSIKGHKFNKVDGNKPALLNLSKDSDKGGGYMFEFDNVGNRDLCRDFVGNVHFVVCECLQHINIFSGRNLMQA